MDLNTAMVMGTVASSAFALGLYIRSTVYDVSDKFTRELSSVKSDTQEKFSDHAIRLAVLEMSEFGATHSGKNPDKMDVKRELPIMPQ